MEGGTPSRLQTGQGARLFEAGEGAVGEEGDEGGAVEDAPTGSMAGPEGEEVVEERMASGGRDL